MIVTAGTDDAATVIRLVTELLRELGAEGRDFAAMDPGTLAAALVSEWARGRFAAFLAHTSDGVPVGVLTLSVGFALYAGGEYGVIDEMYVRPEHRGAGVGRALLEYARSVGTAESWKHLDVTAPEDDRAEQARGFYESQGFHFVGAKLRLPLT